MKKLSLLLALTALATSSSPSYARLNVVTTLPDFAAVAKEVGGDYITVASICRGTEDPHFVDARPSFIALLNKADLLIESGAELEIGWLGTLVNNARNGKILPGAPGRLNAAEGIRLLDVPTGPVDRSQGDVHPLGNPHYWLDPVNAKVLASHLAETLGRLDVANASAYAANARQFGERIDRKLAEWTKLMEPLRGTKVVTYHKSFDYFLARFGLELVGTIEPKPGIEPSPAHIQALVPRAKTAGVKLVITEPFRPRKTPEYAAQAAGAKLVLVPVMVGGHPKIKDTVTLFDYAVGQLTSAR